MFTTKQAGTRLTWWLLVAVIGALASSSAVAQMGPNNGQMMREQEITAMPMERLLAPIPFYREQTFLVLLGAGIVAVGIFAYRVAGPRWRRKKTPDGFASEAVLVVDLVGSTHLATHYGEGLALRAAEILQERTLNLAKTRGLIFAKNTGDGSFMTFSTVVDACRTAVALLRDIIERPPDLAPASGLELRAGISYGEILTDAGNDRHASAINKAFRLEGLSRESFTQVAGEDSNVNEIPERNRILLDEEAVQELQQAGSARVPLRFLGFARLKGFSGLHRVYEVLWSSMAPM